MNFNFTQKYKYYFSDFEIDDLGTKNIKDIIKDKEIKVPLDFTLSIFQKHYKGIVKILCTFKNEATLEKSFYEICIQLIPETNFCIQPFFLTDSAFKCHISEFVQKIWINVLLHLEHIKIPNEIRTNNYSHIEELFIFDNFQASHLDDLTKDVFLIVYTIIKKNKKLKLLSTDDILNTRGLQKNKNSLGIYSGYKKHEREKIHIALKKLNHYGYLSVFEVKPYTYIINLTPQQRQKKYKTIPIKLCQYHYKNELWQKRIGLYLSTYKPSKIKSGILYSLIKELCQSFKPAQIRDKFEEAMDKLTEDNIINTWHYEKINEAQMQGKNWFKKWEHLNIICRY